MSADRPTRREMKRDEFVTTVAELSHAAERHARSLAIAAAAIVVLIVAVSAGIWLSRANAAEASRELAAVQNAAAAPVAELGQMPNPGVTGYATSKQKYEDVLTKAETLLKKHPSSAAAPWASYWRAVALKELGRRDEAQAAAEALIASGGDEVITATAKMLLAQVQEARGDLDAAAATYEALAGSAPPSFPAELALANQARILEAQGKQEAARAVWRRLTQEHPESPAGREASRRMASERN